ncbi:MAG: glycosyltransferase [Acidobacteria bacterium]|nr:glycosyltransferase [Acidobacteriota bacterium]
MMEASSPESSSTRLDVVILTFNEAANLPEALKSLQGLACDLYVVDSGSTDQTAAMARSAGALVVFHPFENYAAQRNWAQRHLPLKNDWILHLDADERLTPELVSEINRLLQRKEVPASGFLIRRRTIFMGRWIRYGGHLSSYHLRLFRRSLGSCENRLYDQHFLVQGRVEHLQNDFINVIITDVHEWTLRHARWAELEARELFSGDQTSQLAGCALGTSQQRKRWLRNSFYYRCPLFARAFAYWLYRYFLRLGFLDGKEGLIFHFLQGCWYRFLVDCHIHEMKRKQRAHRNTLENLDRVARVESGEAQRSRPKTGRLSRGVFYLSAFLLLGVLLHAPLLKSLGNMLLVEDSLEPAAAIVVLGGEVPFRAVEAAELYRQGWASRVLLIPGPLWEKHLLMRDLEIAYPAEWQVNRAVLVRMGVPEAAISISRSAAAGTVEELRIALGELGPGSRPIILVSSKAHTRRVTLTWRFVSAGKRKGIVRPARRDPFDPDQWWRQRRFVMEAVREYLGIVHYWIGYPVPARLPSRPSQAEVVPE